MHFYRHHNSKYPADVDFTHLFDKIHSHTQEDFGMEFAIRNIRKIEMNSNDGGCIGCYFIVWSKINSIFQRNRKKNRNIIFVINWNYFSHAEFHIICACILYMYI